MKHLNEDLKSKRLMYLKAILFVIAGMICCFLILLENFSWRNVLLLIVTIWCFARAYYFVFYVIEHYIDSDYKFSGLWSFCKYQYRKR